MLIEHIERLEHICEIALKAVLNQKEKKIFLPKIEGAFIMNERKAKIFNYFVKSAIPEVILTQDPQEVLNCQIQILRGNMMSI